MEAPVGHLPVSDLVAGFGLNESLARGIKVRPAKTG
jgi:hypothetical protein